MSSKENHQLLYKTFFLACGKPPRRSLRGKGNHPVLSVLHVEAADVNEIPIVRVPLGDELGHHGDLLPHVAKKKYIRTPAADFPEKKLHWHLPQNLTLVQRKNMWEAKELFFLPFILRLVC